MFRFSHSCAAPVRGAADVLLSPLSPGVLQALVDHLQLPPDGHNVAPQRLGVFLQELHFAVVELARLLDALLDVVVGA